MVIAHETHAAADRRLSTAEQSLVAEAEIEPNHGFPDEEVAKAAYYIWEKKGRLSGRDKEHWRIAIEQLKAQASSTHTIPLVPSTSDRPLQVLTLWQQIKRITRGKGRRPDKGQPLTEAESKTAESSRNSSRKINAFISYRVVPEDVTRRREIRVALERKGVEVHGDWELVAGPDYEPQLRGLIRSADAFVFLMSPESVASRHTNEEIDYAAELKKKVLPVLIAGGIDEKALRKELANPQWTRLRQTDDFEAGIESLLTAMNTDYDLTALHTWLTRRADDWQSRGRSRSDLLQGNDLKDATDWLPRVLANSLQFPNLTPLQQIYITASQRERVHRTRQLVGISALLAVFFGVLAAIADHQRFLASMKSVESDGRLRQSLLNQAAFAREASRMDGKANALELLGRAAALAPERLLEQETRRLVSLPADRSRASKELDDMVRSSPVRDLRDEALRALDLPSLLQVWEHTAGEAAPLDQAPGKAGSQPAAGSWLFGPSAFDTSSGRVVKLSDGWAPLVFDLAQGRQATAATTDGAPGLVRSLSSNGRYAVTSRPDGGSDLWDVAKGTRLGLFRDEQGQAVVAKQFAFNRPANLVVVAEDLDPKAGDRSAHHRWKFLIYDCPGLRLMTHQVVEVNLPAGLALSQDGKRLAAECYADPAQQYGIDSEVRIWDLTIGWASQTIRELPFGPYDHSSDGPPTLDFGTEGSTLAMALRDGGIKVWGLDPLGSTRNAPAERWSLTGHPRPQDYLSSGTAIRFSPSGQWLLSAGLDGFVRVWNMESGELAAEAPIDPPSDNLMQSLDWSETGDYCLCGTDQSLRVWTLEPADWRSYRSSEYVTGSVSLAFSPDEHSLARGGQVRAFSLIDLDHPDRPATTYRNIVNQRLMTFAGTPPALYWLTASGEVKSLAFPVTSVQAVPASLPLYTSALSGTAQGVLVAAGRQRETHLTVLDLSNGQVIDQTARPSPYAQHSLCISPRGDRVAFAAGKGPGSVEIVERDLASPTSVADRIEKLPRNGSFLLDLSRGSLRVFVDTVALTWKEGASGLRFGPLRLIVDRNAGFGLWSPLAFSGDGSRCAALNRSKGTTIEVWDLPLRKLLTTIRPGTKLDRLDRWSDPLRFGPDGKRLALLSDHRLEVWNADDGQSVAALPTDAVAFAFRDLDGPGHSAWLINGKGTLSVWEFGKTRAEERGRLRDVNQVALAGSRATITPDGRKLVLVEFEHRQKLERREPGFDLGVWDLSKSTPEPLWACHLDGDFNELKTDPAGTKLALLSNRNRFILSATDRRNPWLGQYGAPPDGSVSISPDGLCCVRGTFSRQGEPVLEVYDVRGTGVVSMRSVPASPVSVALSAEGKTLVVALPDQILIIYRGSEQARLLPAPGKNIAFSQVALNREGSLLASINTTGESISLWDPSRGERLATVPSGPTHLEQIVLSGSGRWLAGSIEGGSVRLWDLSGIRQELSAIGLDWTGPPDIQVKR